MDRRGYLLVTRAQLEEFRRSMGDSLPGRMESCRRWLEGFPMEVWFNPLAGVRTEDARAEVIRTICALYWEGKVNISFNEDMWLRRHANSDEELKEWLASKKLNRH